MFNLTSPPLLESWKINGRLAVLPKSIYLSSPVFAQKFQFEKSVYDKSTSWQHTQSCVAVWLFLFVVILPNNSEDSQISDR